MSNKDKFINKSNKDTLINKNYIQGYKVGHRDGFEMGLNCFAEMVESHLQGNKTIDLKTFKKLASYILETDN